MKKYFVIGNPIDHSLSPKLHNYWIKENNINAVYDKKQLNESGLAEIVEEIKKDKDLEADIVIATPECMKSLGQLGRVLGPKNLMPNPKEGTVTKNIAQAVEKAKKGQIRYKMDKAGIIHTTVGKLDFETTQLTENIKTLINDLIKVKPSSIKGKYMQNLTLSSTMGPGIKVDLSTIAEGSS